MIPSIILIHHHTRKINCLSEYLNLALGERWMRDFDKLMDKGSHHSEPAKKAHKRLVISGAFLSTEFAFTLAYTLMNLLILCYVSVSPEGEHCFVCVGLFGVTQVFILLRPTGKNDYRELWKMTLDTQDITGTDTKE
jgi:hypothetical protein